MQYRALLREAPKLDRDISKLYDRLDEVPVVSGKVTKSGDDFPYIEEHLTVHVVDPGPADEIQKQIAIKEGRLRKVETEKTEIEEFIAGIPDSGNRLIFELIYLNGEKQKDVAKELGYSKGRVSQKISECLKD